MKLFFEGWRIDDSNIKEFLDKLDKNDFVFVRKSVASKDYIFWYNEYTKGDYLMFSIMPRIVNGKVLGVLFVSEAFSVFFPVDAQYVYERFDIVKISKEKYKNLENDVLNEFENEVFEFSDDGAMEL